MPLLPRSLGGGYRGGRGERGGEMRLDFEEMTDGEKYIADAAICDYDKTETLICLLMLDCEQQHGIESWQASVCRECATLFQDRADWRERYEDECETSTKLRSRVRELCAKVRRLKNEAQNETNER